MGSEAFRTLAGAEIVARELPFLLPHEGAVLQGVIDLVARIDGRLTVVDYKTDRVEQAGKYDAQKKWYVEAARKVLDVKLGETFIHPAIAPALVMVGYLMIRIVADIDWTLPENSIPAFLTIAGIPLTFSIAAGIGLGVISYVIVMASTGRAREIHPLMWGIAPFFVAFFAADWLSANVF